jgi:hypothetical protein
MTHRNSRFSTYELFVYKTIQAAIFRTRACLFFGTYETKGAIGVVSRGRIVHLLLFKADTICVKYLLMGGIAPTAFEFVWKCQLLIFYCCGDGI